MRLLLLFLRTATLTGFLANPVLFFLLQALLFLDFMEKLVFEREEVGDAGVLLDFRAPFRVLPDNVRIRIDVCIA